MIHQTSLMAVLIFLFFAALVLGISFYLGRRARSVSGYFAAGGSIHWAVNGIAFAGDYLSAASFLGICGMIAFFGYDGFLYSIGYLAGWIVALFLVAEPIKRLGRYTFADALDSQFNSRATCRPTTSREACCQRRAPGRANPTFASETQTVS